MLVYLGIGKMMLFGVCFSSYLTFTLGRFDFLPIGLYHYEGDENKRGNPVLRPIPSNIFEDSGKVKISLQMWTARSIGLQQDD